MRVEKEAMCVYNHNDSVSAGDNIGNNIVCMIMKVNKKNHRRVLIIKTRLQHKLHL